MLSHAKVSKFHFSIRANKYVCSFNISDKKKKLLKRFIQLFSAYGKSKQLYKLYITCGQCSSHANTQDPREFDQYNYESLVP